MYSPNKVQWRDKIQSSMKFNDIGRFNLSKKDPIAVKNGWRSISHLLLQ